MLNTCSYVSLINVFVCKFQKSTEEYGNDQKWSKALLRKFTFRLRYVDFSCNSFLIWTVINSLFTYLRNLWGSCEIQNYCHFGPKCEVRESTEIIWHLMWLINIIKNYRKPAFLMATILGKCYGGQLQDLPRKTCILGP